MHNANVRLKNGKTYCAPIWGWRPIDGWFSLVQDDGPIEIQFNDVEEAFEYERVDTTGQLRKVDLLERARNDGWKSD